eukprot:SAG31_NODE_44440_length_262_cov_28.036810_1_plen_54_part_10
MNRVPCPEIAVRRLLRLGESTDSVETLRWVAVLIVMLLGWFRADTMAGLRQGDV